MYPNSNSSVSPDHAMEQVTREFYFANKNCTIFLLYYLPVELEGNIESSSRYGRPAYYGRIMGCSNGCGPVTPF